MESHELNVVNLLPTTVAGNRLPERCLVYGGLKN